LSEARHAAPGGCYAFAHLFNGALVPARAVAAAGNVEVGFFIFGEELDYLYRLRAVGPVLTVLGARHLHPDVGGRPLSDAKIYYYVKNTLILHRRYFDRPMLRGLFTIGAVVARAGRRNGVGYALSLMMGRRRAILRRAIERGRRGQVGRDFDV
jgi:GT2 family glycosyltransferase